MKIDNEYHVFEVISKCEQNIISHLKACFIESQLVATVTVVAPRVSMLNRLKKTIKGEPVFDPFSHRIKFEVVETYMRELWPCEKRK